ncbi:hypothetical protein HDV05_004707 [Chytridiales sp. JEL 0842]|nr:hypothetical protein HDV05_004707 [Chytridiales sp. JEL 0842]
MGGEASKQKQPATGHVLSDDHVRKAADVYKGLLGDDQAVLSLSTIEDKCTCIATHLRRALGIFAQTNSHSPTNQVNLQTWLRAAGILTTASWLDREGFIVAYKEACKPEHLLKAVVRDVGASLSLFHGKNEASHVVSERFCNYLISEAGGNKEWENEDFLEWVTLARTFNLLWDTAFQTLFFGSPTNTIRTASHRVPKMSGPASRLLTEEDIFVLNLGMDASLRSPEWTLVYSSWVDGKSWSSFIDRVENIGSVLIVIRDKEGHVFGAFASTPLKQSPKFYGDPHNFLFRLQPSLDIHRGTMINQNYQYFNYGMQMLENGIGFGGQLGYFGLWLDSSFEFGNSKANPRSTTYNSPRLSKSETFTLDTVECLCIKKLEVDERLIPEKKTKKSVFDSHATETAILEMAGKDLAGQNLRQALNVSQDSIMEDEVTHKQA